MRLRLLYLLCFKIYSRLGNLCLLSGSHSQRINLCNDYKFENLFVALLQSFLGEFKTFHDDGHWLLPRVHLEAA